ncbi:hypothetical protein BBD42_05840 [Paenibacillus sp. BIHB 4019]|uniref:Uncharacterized protein n=1 Tax=Paenibacillus sp. BIHB 4019 TaxID=1870819 RepID=A0A1B2DE86_9BACL|nr:hypothetical protein [Paenibacillus sp. BIHB 4019]ANY66032.1 hypothetical protein BBD42_05840 [Paenibacillus sp. BIHB 4019]
MLNKTIKITLFIVAIFLLLDSFGNIFGEMILMKKIFAILIAVISLIIGYFALRDKNKKKE